MSREQLEKTERSLNRQYLHRLSREGMGMKVTPAQRGENLLRKQGFRCILQRTPRWMQENGCGYCLRLTTDRIWEVKEQMDRAGLPYRKIYRQNWEGVTEEVLP